MELAAMGWRNLRRNRRRTILNVFALAIGTAIMIVSVAWVRGYFTSFFEGIIRLDSGHAQILPRGYLDEERRLPLDLAISDAESLRATLLDQPEVTAVAARISFSAQLGDGRRSTRMLGRAIEPEHEALITILPDQITGGSYFGLANEGVLLSDEIAGRLGVSPGDPIFITALDRSGAENFLETVLAGTFSLGYPAIDENVFYVDLASAQRLLGMGDEVSRLVLKLDSGPAVGAITERLREEVARLGEDPSNDDAALEIHGWRTFAEVVVSAVEADTAAFAIILGVLFLLVVIGILNSMSMAVHERRREIGTLRAIGMKRRQLMKLLLAEGVSIAAVGAIAGAAIAGLASIYFGIIGFDLSVLAGTGLPIPFGDRFTADFRGWDFLLGGAVSAVTATAGSYLPARRATRLAIADALGSHLE
jgi:ABC-type lipoprotein release transport system permease subunit